MRLVLVLLLSSLASAQGMGGKSGIGGKAGFGGGLAVSPSVAFDNAVSANASGVTTVTTAAFTITSNANRAAVVGLLLSINSATGITVTVGGQTAALVSGADTGVTPLPTARAFLYCVANPASGSQTASATWTGSSNAWIGAITAYNVDQATPCNNGNQAATAATGTNNLSLSITSNSGDLTTTMGVAPGGDFGAGSTTNQTQKWGMVGSTAGGDVGAGAGTTTHTWTASASHQQEGIVGANFKKSP